MTDTNVPTDEILERVVDELGEMSPQLRKAAHYVVNNPDHVGG